VKLHLSCDHEQNKPDPRTASATGLLAGLIGWKQKADGRLSPSVK